jgi:hypothetical protein
MGAWNAVESALSEAGNALTLGRFLVLRTVRDTPACRIQEVAASQGITLGGPRASWIASTETGSCTAPRVSTTGAQ